jgi:predicted transcriptional regulator
VAHIYWTSREEINEPTRRLRQRRHQGSKPNAPQEKLIPYFLSTKHRLAEKFVNKYCHVDKFLEYFSDKWSNMKDLMEHTRVSETKLTDTLASLKDRGYIKTVEQEVKKTARVEGD